jgi:hypothetical protein
MRQIHDYDDLPMTTRVSNYVDWPSNILPVWPDYYTQIEYQIDAARFTVGISAFHLALLILLVRCSVQTPARELVVVVSTVSALYVGWKWPSVYLIPKGSSLRTSAWVYCCVVASPGCVYLCIRLITMWRTQRFYGIQDYVQEAKDLFIDFLSHALFPLYFVAYLLFTCLVVDGILT